MALYWNDVQRVKRVEEMANKLGFILTTQPYGFKESALIVLSPKDTELPHYARDAEIFSGSVESIESWLQGLEWSRYYDEIIKLSNDKTRSKKEQIERNRQLAQTIKFNRKVDGKLTGMSTIDTVVKDALTYKDYKVWGNGY